MATSAGHRLDTLQTRRKLGGFSVDQLAKAATLSCREIEELENGDSCRPEVTQRILDVLGPPVAITSNTQANPSVITSATHLFQTGDTVVIAGVVGSNADINGTRVITRISATTFSVAIDASVAGGTGGTATLQPASVGIARLA